VGLRKGCRQIVLWVGSFVLVGFVRVLQSPSVRQAGYRISLTSLLLLAGAGSVHDATASNETRTLSFHHTHSGESLTITYKRNGRYEETALKQLNHFLRDWRTQEQTTMDRHLFDILWEVYREVDGKKPIEIISAYRSPATNAMLRRRSAHSGVARSSQHMLGHAMDFFIPGVPLEQIRFAGLRLQRGGVGFYPTSGSPFVHLDTGNVRHWPRMTYEQLARVFPDGRTVHVPSNGKPLPGYQLALAEIAKRGNGDSAFTFEKPKSLLASLFKRPATNDEDEAATDNATAAATPPAAAAKAAATPAPVAVAAVAQTPEQELFPLPRVRPASAPSYQVASADDDQVLPAPRPVRQESARNERAPQTPADIINSRGFWGDTPPTQPRQATPAQVAALSARQALAKAVEAEPTASVSRAFDALAYAPVASPLDRAQIVAASAPMPRHLRTGSTTRHTARNVAAVNEASTIVAKGHQGPQGRVTVSTRIAAAAKNDTVWMRAMILAPSASTAMSATPLGEPDMTAMSMHFVKPQTTVAMNFADDVQPGMVCERFTGTAVASLPTMAFQTAALR